MATQGGTTLLEAIHACLRVPANCVFWWARSKLGHLMSRPEPPRPAAELKTGLHQHLTPARRVLATEVERAIREIFDLEWLHRHGSTQQYLENLHLLETFQQMQDVLPRADQRREGRNTPLRGLDVGSRNWSYVHALQRWLSVGLDGGDNTQLQGVEIDGYWINRDGRPRCDHARANAAATASQGAIEYRVEDFSDTPAPPPGAEFDLITMLFPFVTRYALLEWGLPPWHFGPERVFRRAAEMLRPDTGRLVTAHQTRREALRSRHLAEANDLVLLADRPFDRDLFTTDTPGERRVLVFAKERPVMIPRPHSMPSVATVSSAHHDAAPLPRGIHR